MPIEFSCPSCSSVLRVSDEDAGLTAKCPTCQAVLNIPNASTNAPSPSSGSPAADGRAAPPNPFSPPAAMETQAAPMPPVGALGGTGAPTAVGIGPIFSYASRVWSENLGLLVGCTVVIFVISGAIGGVSGFVGEALALRGDDVVVAVLAQNAISWTGNLIQLFLGIGMTRISLALARKQPADFNMLFGGGDRFLPLLGTSIIAGIVLVFGFLLLIIPGILLALFFWPFYYYVVDRQCPAMDSFGQGYEIAKYNVGTSFVLAIMGIGLTLIGVIALCIGVIFTAPLIGMLWSTAYLMMKGELAS